MERPILFNTDMVKAILEGRKTQTRRILKPQPTNINPEYLYAIDETKQPFKEINQPYSKGDTLWVRETWGDYDGEVRYYLYRADYQDGAKTFEWSERDEFGEEIICDLPKWHPSIHMPRDAARIFLKVTDVRVERLQKITEDGAAKEGFISNQISTWEHSPFSTAIERFKSTWDSIYNNWQENPWVWVIGFERMV